MVTFFVDANVIVYSVTEGERREPCLRILEAVTAGYVDGRTSPAVLEEVWNLERSGRARGIDGLTRRGYEIFSPLVPVDDDAFRLALAVHAPRLGSMDRLHIGTCRAHGIDTIVSADRAFSGLPGIRRVDPFDGRALEGLLA